LEAFDRAGKLDNLGSHQSMVAVGGVKLGEKRISGPFSEAISDVLVVTGMVQKCSVEMVDDIWKVKGIGFGWRKVLVEKSGGGGMRGFFGDKGESGSKRGRGIFSLFKSVSEAMTCFVGLEKTLGILQISFGFPGVF